MCFYSWVTAHVFLLICYYSCVHGQSYVIKCHTHTCLLIICMSRNNYLYNNVHNNLLYLNILYQGSWSFVKSHGNTFTFLFDLFQGGPFCLFFIFLFGAAAAVPQWRGSFKRPLKWRSVSPSLRGRCRLRNVKWRLLRSTKSANKKSCHFLYAGLFNSILQRLTYASRFRQGATDAHFFLEERASRPIVNGSST